MFRHSDLYQLATLTFITSTYSARWTWPRPGPLTALPANRTFAPNTVNIYEFRVK